MSWKIKQIYIENFKYFHQLFTLDANSMNLLIYGENGSGKSSIYWALYTIFQSRLKSDTTSVEKYFDPANDENLRNKYSAAGDGSKVQIVFEDKDNPASADKPYIIEQGNVTTQNTADTFLAFSVASSDFLNYKMLSKLTDKDNSVENDVTDLFVKEIYPFADFANDYVDLDGNHSGIRNALRWYEYILLSKDDLEHQSGKRRKQYDKNGPKYTRFKRLISDFRNELANFVADLSLRATTKLRNEFGIQDIEVKFEIDDEYKFDLPTSSSSRYRDHTLHPLHIRLHAKLVNAQLAGGQVEIVHLRSFFNEAKLTCLGLAIRLSVVDKKYVTGSNLASILCMDDLLVSLDMGYRVPVTKALLKYALHYQLFMFTHDRLLYNMMKGEIKELGYSANDWKCLEFYKSNPANEALQEPKVNMIEVKDIKDKVKLYINQGDYPAAGNYLRKYAEELIKGILPFNHTYTIQGEKVVNLMLKGLYDKTRAAGRDDDFCKLYEITPSIMPDISKHLQRLMNPLSHDDKDVPIFRAELEEALTEVGKYEPIRNGKKVIVARNEAGIRQFKIEMNNGTNAIDVVFVTVEQWDYITFPAPTGKKYKDCEVKIVSSSDGHYLIDSKLRVKKLYEDMKNRVFGIGGVPPIFDQIIVEVATGIPLGRL